MVIIDKQFVGSVDTVYEVAKLDLSKGLDMDLMLCDEKELLDVLDKEKESTDSLTFGEEFSDILLNSNFAVKDGKVIPSLTVDITDSPDMLNVDSIKFDRNAIDDMTTLMRTDGYIVFIHNSKKIVSKSSYTKTTYFRDTEPVFLNKTIAKPLKDLVIVNNSIVVNYEVDNVPYYFEVMKVSDQEIVLSDFAISMTSESFNSIKEYINYSELTESNERVEFKILNNSLGKINYSFDSFFTPLVSAVCNRERVLTGIRDSLKLLRNKKDLSNFLKCFEEVERLGLTHESGGLTWNMTKRIKSIFNIDKLESCNAQVPEFLAMLEIDPDKEFFISINPNESGDTEVAKRVSQKFTNLKPSEVTELIDKIDLELRILDSYLLKAISEKLKIGTEDTSLWIPTNYGHEVISLEVN